MFKLAMGGAAQGSTGEAGGMAAEGVPEEGDLCSQPTISRLENLPDARALLRMGRAMVDHYCQSFRQVPAPHRARRR